MGALFREVILVTNSPEDYCYLSLPMYKDSIRGLGPLGGIYTALEAIPHEGGFFTACDMPFLNRALIEHMVTVSQGFDVVVPRIGRYVEPLHAVYRTGCLGPIGRLIDSEKYQIFKFFREVAVRYMDEDEIRMYDPDLSSFFNINRPQDLRRVTRT